MKTLIYYHAWASGLHYTQQKYVWKKNLLNEFTKVQKSVNAKRSKCAKSVDDSIVLAFSLNRKIFNYTNILLVPE